MSAVSHCACGRRKSRYSAECTRCHKQHMAEIHAKVAAIVDGGVCPKCGAGLVRNLSLTGWWQCEQFGAPQFRKDPSKPACNWQGFTK